MEEEKPAGPEAAGDTLVHKKTLTPSREAVEQVQKMRSESDDLRAEKDTSKYGTPAKPDVDYSPPKPEANKTQEPESPKSPNPISVHVKAVLFYAIYSLAANIFGLIQGLVLLRETNSRQPQRLVQFGLLVSVVWILMDVYLLFGRDKWSIIRILRVNAYLAALWIVLYLIGLVLVGRLEIIGIVLEIIMLLFLRDVMYRVGQE